MYTATPVFVLIFLVDVWGYAVTDCKILYCSFFTRMSLRQHRVVLLDETYSFRLNAQNPTDQIQLLHNLFCINTVYQIFLHSKNYILHCQI